MNAIRSVMSAFLVIVAALCVAGWTWAGGLPSPKLQGARVAVALCLLMSIGAMALIWSAKQDEEK